MGHWFISSGKRKRWYWASHTTKNQTQFLRFLNHNRLVLWIRWRFYLRHNGGVPKGWGSRERWEQYIRTYCDTPLEFMKWLVIHYLVIMPRDMIYDLYERVRGR